MKALPMILLTATISFAATAWGAAVLPTGESVAAGSANVSRSGNAMTVTNSNGAIINWTSFSVGAGGTVQFAQPNAGSRVLNRVTGSDPSSIYGTITSNGQVFLVNPNGIMVGPSGSIQAPGIVLSTAGIADADFLVGNLQFQTPPAGTPIVVAGTLAATDLIDIRASSFDGSGATLNAPNINIDVGGGVVTVGGGGAIGGGLIAGGGGISVGGGGAVTGSVSSVGGSLSLGTRNITVRSETTQKLLQRTAGSISLLGASTRPPSATPAASTPPLPARGVAPPVRVTTGGLVDGIVTVRMSLVDASPITLR